ncbi:hypothetical protein PIROE2DRAFT_13839 [Piromyces sp. E2]|nr:hypothetical protein PIROE2DRAFT_13839 [Piromyces sp. E2]|eukprot:OUM60412.1 hypothetical protein PIROE2DRAFT_13839 [Piromyces sp. E2]
MRTKKEKDNYPFFTQALKLGLNEIADLSITDDIDDKSSSMSSVISDFVDDLSSENENPHSYDS